MKFIKYIEKQIPNLQSQGMLKCPLLAETQAHKRVGH